MNKILSSALLLVFSVFALQTISAAPDRVTDLVGVSTNGAVIASWTVQPSSAPVTNVVMKISTQPINALNWNSVTNVVQWMHTLGPVGTTQQVIDSDVTPGVTYYLAIKIQDDTGAWSPISNLPLVTAGSSTYYVDVTWEQAVDPNVVGYKIYYGTSSRSYTNSIAFGNLTQGRITGLQYGVEYYFSGTSYDANGNESDFCNEVKWP